MYWLSLFILVSMNDGPRQPQAISYSKHSYYSQYLAQTLFSLTGNTEIYYDCTHAKHSMDCNHDQKQYFKYEDYGVAQV